MKLFLKETLKLTSQRGMAKITFPHPPSHNSTVAGVHMEAGACAPVSLPWAGLEYTVWGQKITFYVFKFILVFKNTVFWETLPKMG